MPKREPMVNGRDLSRAVRAIESDLGSSKRHWVECASRSAEWLEVVKKDPNASGRIVARAERDVDVATRKLAALAVGKRVTLLNNCDELEA